MSKITTKQRIVLEAIRMFNEQGEQYVTSHHTAAELEISHGNLDHYYNTKEDYLLAIWSS